MEVTIEMIKELREETGAGVLDAKNALVAANGDFEKAASALREKGLERAAKRAGREAREGVIELYAHLDNRVGVMLELNCETDFVARNDRFRVLAHDLALHIAAMEPKYVSRQDIPQEVLEQRKEEFRSQALAEGKPERIVEKIVEGRLNKLFGETVLLDQPFVKDEEITIDEYINRTVAVLGENIVLRRFIRYELGEEL